LQAGEYRLSIDGNKATVQKGKNTVAESEAAGRPRPQIRIYVHPPCAMDRSTKFALPAKREFLYQRIAGSVAIASGRNTEWAETALSAVSRFIRRFWRPAGGHN